MVFGSSGGPWGPQVVHDLFAFRVGLGTSMVNEAGERLGGSGGPVSCRLGSRRFSPHTGHLGKYWCCRCRGGRLVMAFAKELKIQLVWKKCPQPVRTKGSGRLPVAPVPPALGGVGPLVQIPQLPDTRLSRAVMIRSGRSSTSMRPRRWEGALVVSLAAGGGSPAPHGQRYCVGGYCPFVGGGHGHAAPLGVNW